MSIIDDLRNTEQSIASAVNDSVSSTKAFIAAQVQANAEKIAAYESAAATALAHANILKAENDKLAPFV